MALLEVRDLVVEFSRPGGPVTAVAGVDLDVRAGEVVGLVGESGCGKSTLARSVVGLTPRSRGTVRLDGRDVSPLGRRARPVHDRMLQMVFQDPYASLNPRRKVGRQIADGLRPPAAGAGAPRPAQERVRELLLSVGLEPDVAGRFPHEFSGGQRQRIAIARTLAVEPRVIVADEAVSALDASTQAQVADLFVELVRSLGLGLLFISHDLSVVRRIADTVAVMYLGRIVEHGPTASVWTDQAHPYSQALIAAAPRLGPEAQLPAALPGEVPDPAHPPPGCRFHTRCPYVFDRCRSEDPRLLPVTPEHRAACLLVDPAEAAAHGRGSPLPPPSTPGPRTAPTSTKRAP